MKEKLNSFLNFLLKINLVLLCVAFLLLVVERFTSTTQDFPLSDFNTLFSSGWFWGLSLSNIIIHWSLAGSLYPKLIEMNVEEIANYKREEHRAAGTVFFSFVGVVCMTSASWLLFIMGIIWFLIGVIMYYQTKIS